MRPPDSPEVDLSKMELKALLIEKDRNHAEEMEGLKAEIRRLTDHIARLEAESALCADEIPRKRVGGDETEAAGPSTALVVFKPPTEVERQRRRLSIEFGETFISPSDAPLRVMRAVTGAINKMEWEEIAVSFIDTIKASSGDVTREVGEWFDANFPIDSSSRGMVRAARDNFKTCLVEVAVKLRPMVKVRFWQP